VGKSHFARDVGLKELKGFIAEASASGMWRAEGGSMVLEADLGRIVGTDLGGASTSWIRIVTTPSGEVITAYPIARP